MQSILLTGFEPFHKASQNPTQAIVETIAKENLPSVSTLVLPVVFGKASEILISKIDELKPDVVIMLGQAEGRSHITPEKIAVNLDEARIEDNDGNQPRNEAIVAGGADALFSTLPVEKLVEALTNAGYPASVSMTAGTFVCNHIFYAVQHHLLNRDIKSGFIHVPLMDSQASEFPGLPRLSLDVLIGAVKTVIEKVQ